MTDTISENPLLEAWTGPFEAPPFDQIRPEHFRPAFDIALQQAREEIAAIAENSDPPTFANTIEAMERSGRSLDKAAAVFFNLAGTDATDELEAIEREITPILSRHRSEIFSNEALFSRIDALKRDEANRNLDAEQARVLERYHLNFTRNGAGLPAASKNASPTSASGWRALARSLARMFWPTKNPISCCWRRAISMGCQRPLSPAPRASRPSAAMPGNMA